jgi:ABC-type branched-subunit amino acid transport system substrate-binding protein
MRVMPLSRRGMLRSAVLAIGVATSFAACSRTNVPLEPPMSVRRGDEAFRYRSYESAIGDYRTYLDETEYGAYTPRVFYKSALAAYRLGHYHLTLTTLDELKQRYPSGSWVQVDALRGDAERALGNDMQALQAWDAGWRVASDSDREKLRQRILTVARGLDSAQLARARRLVTTTGVVRLIDQEMAKPQPPAHAATAAEDTDELGEPALEAETAPRISAPQKARPQISEPTEPLAAPVKAAVPSDAEPTRGRAEIETEPVVADKVTLDEQRSPIPASDATIRGVAKVGCILPLTGPNRDFGESAVRGIRLAFGSSSPPLLVKDAGMAPALAVSALDDLSRDPNVVAVIGPLRSDQAEAVAPEAEHSGVPLFLLSQRDGLNGRFLMQVGVTRSRLIGSLLDYAMTKARLRRFGVLYPDDAYGREFLSAFRAEADRRGAQLVGAQAYPPGAAALSGAEVNALRKWRDSQNLQAIFLPDGAGPAARLATFLQREMPDVTLLGPYGWESLADGSEGTALNGVLFADGFYASSARPATREFVRRFQEAYGRTPGLVEAQAYDAGLLVKRALDAGARSRADVLRQLRGVGTLDGATGDLQVTPAGFERSSFLLQVYDGRLEEVSGNEG